MSAPILAYRDNTGISLAASKEEVERLKAEHAL